VGVEYGYTCEALVALRMMVKVGFICIDGSHLLRKIGCGQRLLRLHNVLWRNAGETAEAHIPVGPSAEIAEDR
jgi:hypothetical protein